MRICLDGNRRLTGTATDSVFDLKSNLILEKVVDQPETFFDHDACGGGSTFPVFLGAALLNALAAHLKRYRTAGMGLCTNQGIMVRRGKDTGVGMGVQIV